MEGSDISGFYKIPLEKRVDLLKERCGLTPKEVEILKGALEPQIADKLIENVVGGYMLPLGIATHLRVNDKDYLVPLAIEETSVVAGLSHAAKIARVGGGVRSRSSEMLMIGQIHLKVDDVKLAEKKIKESEATIIRKANKRDSTLIKIGGGAKYIETRTLDNKRLVIHLIVDVKDAMGANVVNSMSESVSPLLERLTDGKTTLKIVTNLADKRLVHAETEIPPKAFDNPGKNLDGEEVIKNIVEAYKLAEKDVYRAVTHNKGIMNGIDGLAIATGNDFRALEAGAHAYASRTGKYKPLTRWYLTEKGNLKGEITIPIAVGTVGGVTKVHPSAQLSLKILGVKKARELSEVVAAVGLLQNMAAIRALATEGIQKGHMKLHAKNIAMQAGVQPENIEQVVQRMVEENDISQKRAEELNKSLK